MDTFEVGAEHVRDATDMVAVRENFLATSGKPRGVRLHLRGRVAPVDGRVGGSGTWGSASWVSGVCAYAMITCGMVSPTQGILQSWRSMRLLPSSPSRFSSCRS